MTVTTLSDTNPTLELLWLTPPSQGAGVAIARGDLQAGLVSGNKWFKLQGHLKALEQNPDAWVASPGGPWSNHLHALGAACHRLNRRFVAIVRGPEPDDLSPTLIDLKQWGAHLVFVSRQAFRQRYDNGWVEEMAIEALKAEGLWDEAPVFGIPEGGSSELAFEGLAAWSRQMVAAFPKPDVVVLPVGSGGTLAGLRKALPRSCRVEGILAVRDELSIRERVNRWLQSAEDGPWELISGHEGPGFGRLSAVQCERIPELEESLGCPLDPVYTGKMMLAFLQRWREGYYRDQRVLLVHTGGLQGRRSTGWPEHQEFPARFGYPILSEE